MKRGLMVLRLTMRWRLGSLSGKQQKTAPPVARQSRFPRKFLKISCEIPGGIFLPQISILPKNHFNSQTPTALIANNQRHNGDSIHSLVEYGHNHQKDGLGKWWRDGGSLYLLLFAFEVLVLAFSRHSLARQQSKTHPAIVGDVGFQNDHKVLAATKMLVFELNVHFDHRAKFSRQDQYGS